MFLQITWQFLPCLCHDARSKPFSDREDDWLTEQWQAARQLPCDACSICPHCLLLTRKGEKIWQGVGKFKVQKSKWWQRYREPRETDWDLTRPYCSNEVKSFVQVWVFSRRSTNEYYVLVKSTTTIGCSSTGSGHRIWAGFNEEKKWMLFNFLNWIGWKKEFGSDRRSRAIILFFLQ